MSQYIRYPAAGGSGSGIDTYATVGALPASAADGAVAAVLDTDTLYIFDGDSETWKLIAGPGVALSIGTFDSGTPSANGAHIDSNALIMQSASATNPGLVNTGAQTFAGAKTFNSTIAASNFSGSSSGTNTGDITLAAVGSAPNGNGASLSGQQLTLQPADGTNPGVITAGAQTIGGAKTFSTAPILSSLTASLPLKLDGSKNMLAQAIDLSTAEVTGTLAAGRFPALTGDVTTSAGSLATTLASTISGAKTFSTSLSSAAFISTSSNAASAGQVRLANSDTIRFRNAANGGDISFGAGSADAIPAWGGVDLANVSTAQTLTNKTLDAASNTISNIANANIAGAAAIAYSKLDLAGSILNADINASAAIALSKLATVTGSRVLVSSAGGVISASSVTTTTLGFLDATSSIQTQLDAKQARSTLTTKGDIYVATASATVARQGIGSDGDVLTADSSQTNGLKWATPASAPTSSKELSNLGLSTSVGSSALTISLKQSDGSTDPASGAGAVKIGFRSSTITSGAYNQRSATAATSVVVSSGSTLGHASGVDQYIYVYAIDNAGTIELAVSSSLFDEGTRVSTTAEGGSGGADSRAVMYSTTARSNVPCRLIGRLLSNQATAGTWASNMSAVAVMPFDVPEPVMTARRASSDQTIASSAVLVWNTVEEDSHNGLNTTTGVYTVPMPGSYLVTGQAMLANITAATTDASVTVRKNSSSVSAGRFFGSPLSGTTTIQVVTFSKVVNCAIGDTIDILATGDASFDAVNGDCGISIVRVSAWT